MGATAGIIAAALSALRSVAGAVGQGAHGPQSSALAPQQRGAVPFRPTALGQQQGVNVPGADDEMRLSQMLKLAGYA